MELFLKYTYFALEKMKYSKNIPILGWPARVTAADVRSCGTYDASDDGSVYVRVDESKPASALQRRDGGWAAVS